MTKYHQFTEAVTLQQRKYRLKEERVSMYKLLIADDEQIVLDSIKFIIEKNFYIWLKLEQRGPDERL